MTGEGREPSSRRRGIGDVIGGFVAGLYSVPEGIGHASLAGINPMYGVYAGMVPVAAAFGTRGGRRDLERVVYRPRVH